MAGAAPYNDERAREIIKAHMGLEGPALPILHALMEEFGHVPESAVKDMAEALNISRAESCQSMGAEKQANEFLAKLKLNWGETTPDGALTVEPVYCLGLCAHSPSALIDGEPVGCVDMETLDGIVAEARR